MRVQGKVWGETTEFFMNPIFSAYHLSVKKGGVCSEHYHNHKSNLFYVISGKLEVTIWQGQGLKDITVLGPGQSTAVPPGMWHKFKGLSEVECIEIYQVFLQEPDIERRTTGKLEEQ